MVTIATRIRTSLAVGSAIGTLIAAAIMSPQGRNAAPPVETVASSNGLQISARLASNRILPIGQDQNLVITVAAPATSKRVAVRPPMSLAIVIDRSGSMSGAPIEHAKAAALSMLRQLGPTDAFSVVTYSSSSEVVLPMQWASEANKDAARTAIETIHDDGGTCISCGLDLASQEVTRSPILNGLRRMLVISDGQANAGVYDRDELAQLAASKAASGVSLSTVGVGLDFDERTMRRLAEVGHGNYYFVEDTVALSAMFGQELESLGQVVASDIRVTLQSGTPEVQILEAYGYPMAREGGGFVVPVADLRSGETRKIVVRVRVEAPTGAELAIAKVDVAWRQVAEHAAQRAQVTARASIDSDPAAVDASIDRPTVQAIEEALSARALEDASAAYEKDGLRGAQQVMDRRAGELRMKAKYLPKPAVQALESAADDTIRDFAVAPAKAKKAASVRAYKLSKQ